MSVNPLRRAPNEQPDTLLGSSGTVLRALVFAWLIPAFGSSIPWLVMAHGHLVDWVAVPRMLPILALHTMGAAFPIIAAFAVSQRREPLASLLITALSASWLLWHLVLFGSLAWLQRDALRVALSITTLVAVTVISLRAGLGRSS